VDRLSITVAGKGGTGKTVISGTLARILARRGHQVLAVDSDENPMLAISLGVPVERISDPAPIPTDFWMAVERPDTGRAAILKEPPDVLVSRHGVPGPDGVTLLSGAVVENEGCTSDAGVRNMLGVLLGRSAFDRVITDFEAGVDEPAWALGGLLNPADVLLIVSTSSPVALDTAAKIAGIAREAEIAHVFGVANQVRSDAERESVSSAFAGQGIECLAVIPFDEVIAGADAEGISPVDAAGNSAALEELQSLADRLERLAAPLAPSAR
jgi:CO dehydrogenase maturation factor